jgi:NTP pyrophosphatase (non-canonical NTP hydrolase)
VKKNNRPHLRKLVRRDHTVSPGQLKKETMLQELFAIAQDLNRHFPDGNEPYQIMTRLLEECGELAQQVHHFERKAPKLQKYGEPNNAKMAKEVKDVIRAALQIALYYGIEKQVEETFAQSYQAIKKEN